MSGQGFFDSLETQLGAGFDRAASRRTSRRRVAERAGGVALGLVALAVTMTIVLGEEPAEAGVTVEQRDGLVYVRLTDVEYRTDVIEAAAAAAGLDVAVEAVPASPSVVGRFIRYNQSGEDVGELRELDRDGPTFSGFTIPAGFDGRLILQVGRPAADGEPYALFANALSKGEPLACTSILGTTPTRAADTIRERDVDARWLVVSTNGLQPVDSTELGVDSYAKLRVTRALSTGPGAVTLYLATDSVPPPAMELSADAVC